MQNKRWWYNHRGIELLISMHTTTLQIRRLVHRRLCRGNFNLLINGCFMWRFEWKSLASKASSVRSSFTGPRRGCASQLQGRDLSEVRVRAHYVITTVSIIHRITLCIKQKIKIISDVAGSATYNFELHYFTISHRELYDGRTRICNVVKKHFYTNFYDTMLVRRGCKNLIKGVDRG